MEGNSVVVVAVSITKPAAMVVAVPERQEILKNSVDWPARDPSGRRSRKNLGREYAKRLVSCYGRT